MVNFQDFIDAGYVKWDSTSTKNYSSYGLQKRVRNEAGETKYFITVYAFDFREYKISKDWSFQAEVHLYQEDNAILDGVFSFQVIHVVESIDVLEKWLENMYSSMQCIPDVHNN